MDWLMPWLTDWFVVQQDFVKFKSSNQCEKIVHIFWLTNMGLVSLGNNRCAVCEEIAATEELIQRHVARDLVDSFKEPSAGPAEITKPNTRSKCPKSVSNRSSVRDGVRDGFRCFKVLTTNRIKQYGKARMGLRPDESALALWTKMSRADQQEWQKQAQTRFGIRSAILKERRLASYSALDQHQRRYLSTAFNDCWILKLLKMIKLINLFDS